MWTSGGLVGLLVVAGLVLVPASPAAALQAVSWTQSAPTTATVGDKVSVAVTGTANTFLGTRITGCFATFPDGNNYSNPFGGSFTSGTCSYTDRTLPTVGPYTIIIGFTLSTGSSMTLSTTVSVLPPTPVVTVPSGITTGATSVDGAAVTFEATATDSYFGSSSATCSPASGSIFSVGTTVVTCVATNPGGVTGVNSFPVTVAKTSPVLLWNPPSPVSYGTTYGDLSTAAMQRTDATGPISYSRADGAPIDASDSIPVGDDQILRATYVPSGAAVAAYNEVTVAQTITVVRAVSSVSFGSDLPTAKHYGDAPFSIGVSGTAGGGAVAVSAQTGSDCSVSSPDTSTSVAATVTLTGSGSCVLLADQPETSTHTAAPTAQWSVTVAKGNPLITWAPRSTLTYGDPVSDLLDATANVPGTFAYLVDGIVVEPATVPEVGESHSISVTFTPDNLSYVEATSDHEFAVEAARQTLAVGAIDGQVFGAAPFDLELDGTGPGVVTATATGICVLNNLTVTLVAAGQCTVTVSKAATANYLAAESVTRIFAVLPAGQTLTVDAIADRILGVAPFSLVIGGTGPGVVSAVSTGSCTVVGLTVTVVRSGQCIVTVSKASAHNYAAATPVTLAFTVVPAAPTVKRVSPAVGPTTGKTSVTITGTGFTGATVVRFGSTAVRFTVTNSSSIVAVSPVAKVGTYDISITGSGGTSAQVAADRYVVRPVPRITKLSATSGPKAGKKKITIRGTGFTGATVVTFGTARVAVTVKNDTTMVVTSPRQKAGKYDIRVTTPGGTSAKAKADVFTVKK